MKFQLIVLEVCLIFYTYDSANFQKASGDNTIRRKCYSLLRWPCCYRMCSSRRLLFKQTGGNGTKETITHHFFVSGIGRRNCRCGKNLAAQKMLLKRNPANVRKWIARFLYTCSLHAEAHCGIAHNNCMSCPSIWATLSTAH